MFGRRVSTFFIGFAGVAVLAACGPSGSGAGAGSPSSSPPAQASSASSGAGSLGSASPSAATAVVTIKDFAYTVPKSVSPGAKVMVTNGDQVAHTVTADQSGSLFDVMVDPGGSASFVAPDKPGSYRFHCTYHSNMHGMLVVK